MTAVDPMHTTTWQFLPEAEAFPPPSSLGLILSFAPISANFMLPEHAQMSLHRIEIVVFGQCGFRPV